MSRLVWNVPASRGEQPRPAREYARGGMDGGANCFPRLYVALYEAGRMGGRAADA